MDFSKRLVVVGCQIDRVHLVINQTNSLKVIQPLPSWSTSPMRSRSSPSVGVQPNVLMTCPSSTVVMVPPPSLQTHLSREECFPLDPPRVPACQRKRICRGTLGVCHQKVHQRPAKILHFIRIISLSSLTVSTCYCQDNHPDCPPPPPTLTN